VCVCVCVCGVCVLEGMCSSQGKPVEEEWMQIVLKALSIAGEQQGAETSTASRIRNSLHVR
jgi:hypothetical protein